VGAGLLAGLATPGYRRLLWHSLSIRPPAESLLTQIDGAFYLLTRPLLLLQVNIDPGLAARESLTADLAVKAVLLCGLLAAGLLSLKRRPWVGVGLVWTLLHLVPTNALLPRLDVANDRQLYLAMLGPALLLAGELWARAPRPLAAGATVGLALILAAATVARNGDYATEVALWTATVARSPHSARAWNNLGYAQQLAGNLDGAGRAYERALALDAGHTKARWNLEAVKEMRAAGCGTRNEERNAECLAPSAGTRRAP
jgi:tetratricopeptide (TPR) repeat protein